eukprot:CAMPEP_0177658294 /NCGR_PEP_ID=MMETSP0447-20121125/16722_1 /TAXON_ID=0 /ORGANISM="Stygamoeba regulata, Strain BSH-02190019" /LENGTH=471 /DNA_ID=CAMNT_0019162867 /DNA_START=13 /DNA_END=1428 /DNA_ORIENTATION=+
MSDAQETTRVNAEEAVKAAHEYDITSVVGNYLDRHLVFPLLEFLQLQGIYAEEDILDAKLELLSKTNMVDYAIDIHQSRAAKLEGEKAAESKEGEEKKAASAELLARRQEVMDLWQSLLRDAAPLLNCFQPEDPDKEDSPLIVDRLKEENLFHMSYLQEKYGANADALNSFFKFAKFQYDIGKYAKAAEYLRHYRMLSNHEERNLSALWGQFAAQILTQDWEMALSVMLELKELIDTRKGVTPTVQLQQRTWLIHWSLFVFFNHPNGRNGIIDMFFQERYLNAIETTCPHILRYLSAAVITNRRRRNVLKDLVRAIETEAHTYRDPVTEFLECLYSRCDFDAAQLKLRECEKVLDNDFFLVACKDEFLENARLCIFETYCRIHSCIDIGMLAAKLDLEQEAAEHWIVNLIRNAHLDAKIDSAANQVVLGTLTPSVYQLCIEKTKGLSFRTYMMANNLNKLSSGSSSAVTAQ